MTIHYLNFQTSTSPSAPAPWVNQSPGGTWATLGEKFSDINGSGVSLWLTAAFAGEVAGLTSTITETYHGIPKEAWHPWAYTNVGSPSEIEIRGLPASTMVTVSVFAAASNNRDLDVITNQGTFRLDHPSSLPPPSEPLAVPVLTDGAGTAVMQFSAVTVNAAVAGLIIEYSSGPSIAAADDITSEGGTATFTLSGNSAAPASATLNGTDVGTITDQGSGVYSYTAPLIQDDDTADLVVSVDGTTASATIAYANSYDRDQLTHPATEAEYSENSLSYPNAYATTQAYEWKVIADANASVVTIDWNALEADDGFHKDVASYATPVANGSTTVTLGVFVPETGQAYQFDRTITVSDGSVVVTGEGLWRDLFRDPTEELFTELFR